MTVDWQAYLDGSLPAYERKIADQLLKESASAQRELAGLTEFKNAIHVWAMQETGESSAERLAALVQQARSAKVRSQRVRWGVLSLAASILLMAAIYKGPTNLADSKQRMVILNPDPQQAQAWVRQNSQLPAPLLVLSSTDGMRFARVGKDWACYDYAVDGKVYYLYMKREPLAFWGAPSRWIHGKQYFIGAEGGVGWHYGTLAFLIKGGEEPVRWKLAQEAVSKLEAGHKT